MTHDFVSSWFGSPWVWKPLASSSRKRHRKHRGNVDTVFDETEPLEPHCNMEDRSSHLQVFSIARFAQTSTSQHQHPKHQHPNINIPSRSKKIIQKSSHHPKIIPSREIIPSNGKSTHRCPAKHPTQHQTSNNQPNIKHLTQHRLEWLDDGLMMKRRKRRRMTSEETMYNGDKK